MTVTSRPITCKLSSLKDYIGKGFAGTCGAVNHTGGFSIICNPSCMSGELTADTTVPAVLTVVQWDDSIPLSADVQFSINSIANPETVTVAQALAALKALISLERK